MNVQNSPAKSNIQSNPEFFNVVMVVYKITFNSDVKVKHFKNYDTIF
jgi:hypothetical protein